MIETYFYSALSSASTITAITANRIYPLQLPQDSPLPAITYQIIGGSASPTLNTSGMLRTRIQIDCWGGSYSDAVTLRYAVITALDGYKDQNFTAQLIMPRDVFDYESLHYQGIVEFYLLSTSL